MTQILNRKIASIALVFTELVMMSTVAKAAPPMKFLCQEKNTLLPELGWPMEVIYDGDTSGTLSIMSEHIKLLLPVTKETRTGELDGKPHSVTGIVGSAEVQTIMPDLAALDACAASSMQPEFKNDADMYFMATTSCVAKTPLGQSPVAVTASVSLALVPTVNDSSPDVIFELKRTYVEKSAAPNGVTSIENFSGCSIAAN